MVERDSAGMVTQSFYTGQAFNIQLAYLYKNKYEVAGRFTMIDQDPTTQREDIRQYTLGGSKYIVGHNLKAQADITYKQMVDIPDLWMFRLQIEMAF